MQQTRDRTIVVLPEHLTPQHGRHLHRAGRDRRDGDLALNSDPMDVEQWSDQCN